MSVLYFLESIRCSALDVFFSVITLFGEETALLAIGLIVFWCVDKYKGYYLLSVGFIGIIINQTLKMICRVPRPWVKDPNFTIVESAREAATGYSFPSGHTQSSVGLLGCVAKITTLKVLRWGAVALAVLVPISRMYLGVHTPYDVVVSLGIATLLVFILHPFFANEERFERSFPWIVGIATIFALGLLIYVNLLPSSIDGVEQIYIDSYAQNIESARKNAATLFGCMAGLLVVYPIDRLYTRFKTEARWYAQVIKLVLGLGLVILIKSVMQAPLEAVVGLFCDTPAHIARGIRYFLIVIFAGGVWPLTFSSFAKMQIHALDSLGEKVRSWFVKTDTPST